MADDRDRPERTNGSNDEDSRWQAAGPAVGRIPSGLYILSCRDGDRDQAILVSWVQQAAFQPLAVTVCLRADRPVTRCVRSTQRFALSILGEDQADLVARFARGVSPEQDPFHELFIERAESGCAVLQEAVAALDCRVLGESPAGDHVVFVAEVTGGKLLRDVKPWVHVRKDGTRY